MSPKRKNIRVATLGSAMILQKPKLPAQQRSH
jgi:hypothetical protein